jgi:hypothetical protein
MKPCVKKIHQAREYFSFVGVRSNAYRLLRHAVLSAGKP